ncbi:MAG TPA: hypothetical protein VHU40_03075, partial [Polyangia bacterium]|nr:hypothetical protein [Polyangia bacterium]
TTGAHADDAAALLQISTDIQNAAAQAHVDAERATFLLQVVAISVGFSLGFSIWACWLKGRQARNP